MSSVIVNENGLTADQQAAADGFFNFLFSQEKELAISGPAGVGKTFLMGYLIDRVLPSYQKTCKVLGIDPLYHSVMMTATTNKAADVLGTSTKRPTQTAHSFMNLRVQEDFNTGKTNIIKTRSWTVHTNMILFIDEAYTIDSQLYRYIHEGTVNCKIVYVGDHCQLPPVMEKESPIYTPRIQTFLVEQPVRNAHQPALRALCDQLRETVKTGIFKPIQTTPGVVDWLDGPAMQREIDQHFVNESKDCRVLAYTNACVNDYNAYIREARQLPPGYAEGEIMIANSAIITDKANIGVEEELTIAQLHYQRKVLLPDGAELDVIDATIISKFGSVLDVRLPADKEHHAALIKYFARKKDWPTYFKLKGDYPDLRPKDASTVHKAQGSTHETVFIDADNLSTCHQPALAARLLYVASSRAQNRIVFYGRLADKYGPLLA